MKIFLDTINTELLKQWAASGLIDGITTNPTLLSKTTINPTELIMQICHLLPFGSVSVEITEDNPEAVYIQARKIAALADNITVKIPCHARYYSVIKKLIEEGISVNITLVFSLTQGLMMAKLGADYISAFIGRLDENGGDGIALIKQLRHMLDWYGFETKLLAASIRTIDHLEQAIIAGADVATISQDIFQHAISHELTDRGLIKFLADWKQLGLTHFP
jgi:transaldolase